MNEKQIIKEGGFKVLEALISTCFGVVGWIVYGIILKRRRDKLSK